MNQIRINAFFILILLCATAINAQTSLTAKECLKLAFGHSYQLKLAESNTAIISEQFKENKAQLYPSLNINGMYTRIGEITSFTIPTGAGQSRTFTFGTQNRINVDAKLQYPLYTWGRISAGIGLSQEAIKLATKQKSIQKMNLTDQVLRAYYSLVLNLDLVRLQQKNEQSANRFLQIARDRFNAGGIPKLEMMRAEIQAKSAESRVKDAQNSADQALLMLADLTGLNENLMVICDSLNFEALSTEGIDFEEISMRNRNELQILSVQEAMNRQQMELTSSANKPNFFLFSSYNVQNGFDPVNPDRLIDNWNSGLQVSVPLFDGFATSHRIEQAKIQGDQVRIQKMQSEEAICLDVRKALLSLEQAQEQISENAANLALAEEIQTVSERQYRNGMVAYIDVLNAQQVLSQNQILYTRSLYNHIMAKLNLCQATSDYSLIGIGTNLTD